MKRWRRIAAPLLAALLLLAVFLPLAVQVSGVYTGTFQFDEHGKFTVMQLTDI